MNEQSFIKQRLDSYSELFDMYMDTGVVQPPKPNTDPDPLREYLIEAISEPSNHFHCLEDEDWREVFKNSLFEFLSVMVNAFVPLEQLRQDERKFRLAFMGSPLDEKRKHWEQVSSYLQEAYNADDVNGFGFLQQLQEASGPEEYDAVFSAMDDIWAEAAKARILKEEQRLIRSNRQQFEFHVAEAGSSDYKTALRTRKIVLHNPALREILKLIGREKPQSKEEKDTVVTRYIPFLLSQSPAKTEVDGVKIGNHIPDALPADLVYLAERDTEDVFYHRFATSQLQLMASKPPTISKEKTDIKKTETPRLIKGPIIVSVDTSGSMMGRPMDIATALLMQLLTMARKQRRSCYLITYSVHAQAIDLASPSNWRQVKNFLKNGFSGGTDGTEMILESIKRLQSKSYSMADVLIISDFCWSSPSHDVMEKMKKEQAKGTKFYGLEIDTCSSVRQHKWLDRFWSIKV